MEVIISRIIHRTKVPYARPARYVSNTQLIYIDDKGEHHKYYTDKIRTYKQFIDWVKKRFGENHTYKIQMGSPQVLYVFNGNV